MRGLYVGTGTQETVSSPTSHRREQVWRPASKPGLLPPLTPRRRGLGTWDSPPSPGFPLPGKTLKAFI